ncbi:MAG TPA: hypothetical protein VKB71_19020 [Rhizomicrobium sp.]|nr:hypothetical protein [Rhizomicrobium sp.]
MPALVNIKVGSLRGTSGDDGTISWPFRAKKFRKVDLMSLTLLIIIQSESWPAFAAENIGFSGAVLLDKGSRTVYKTAQADHRVAAEA